MDRDSHDPNQPPWGEHPWWCLNADYAPDSLDHGDRHEGHALAIDAEQPNGVPTTAHTLLVLPVGGTATRVLLTDGDTDLLTVTAPCSRSLAAALTRLADVAEGVVSL